MGLMRIYYTRDFSAYRSVSSKGLDSIAKIIRQHTHNPPIPLYPQYHPILAGLRYPR
jgi:hypothetical protein